MPEEARNAVGPTLRAIATYCTGQPEPFDKFIQNSMQTVGPDIQTHLLLAFGPASAVLNTSPLDQTDHPWMATGIALGLALEHKDDEAQKYLERAAGLVEARSQEDKAVAVLLRATEPPSLAAIQRVAALPAEKAVLLALLAERFPMQRAAYRQEAARFNLRRSPPYLLVRRAIETEATPQP